MKEIKICIAGLGNVGSSVVQSLIDSKNFINSKSNFNIHIVGISAKNKNKNRLFDISKYKWFEKTLRFFKY
jgi:Homoserine dehydrogenase